MTKRTLEEITAEIEALIERDQQRMQCMIHPSDGARALLEELDQALLEEFGRALVAREIQDMFSAYWQQLVATGQAIKHEDGRVTRRYD